MRADQCHALPASLDDGAGALIEPLAVALHAVRRAGPLAAKRVLVSGAGTIGLLAAMAARAAGASSVVACDLSPAGASVRCVSAPTTRSTQRTRRSRSSVRELAGDGFDVVVEAAGAPASLRRALELVRPGGTIVQVGTLGAADVPLPANQLMNRELQLVGSFRYGDEFADAIGLVAHGRREGRRAGERGLPARRGRARSDAGRRHRLGDQGPDRDHARPADVDSRHAHRDPTRIPGRRRQLGGRAVAAPTRRWSRCTPRRGRGRDRETARRQRDAAAAVDPPALDRRREPRHGRGLRDDAAARARSRLPRAPCACRRAATPGSSRRSTPARRARWASTSCTT